MSRDSRRLLVIFAQYKTDLTRFIACVVLLRFCANSVRSLSSLVYTSANNIRNAIRRAFVRRAFVEYLSGFVRPKRKKKTESTTPVLRETVMRAWFFCASSIHTYKHNPHVCRLRDNDIRTELPRSFQPIQREIVRVSIRIGTATCTRNRFYVVFGLVRRARGKTARKVPETERDHGNRLPYTGWLGDGYFYHAPAII